MSVGTEVVLSGSGLSKAFGFGASRLMAVNDVAFEFHRGEIVSIVGESGSGKTTFSKIVLGLLKQSAGTVLYHGKLREMRTHRQRRGYWTKVQAIFQDPFAAFNMFYTVERLLKDCIGLQGARLSKPEMTERMREACQFVNLKYEELHNKYPFELSGGQMQRLMIARICILQPDILIADEPTSMIDACSRSTILEMLMKLRDEKGMTIVFITHDVGLAYYVSDTVYIMQKGRFVETGSADEVILAPRESYTRQLIGDVPKLGAPWDFEGLG